MSFDFINLDDNIYVWQNQFVKRGFTREGIEYAFTANMPYWHPLTWLSHMLDVQLFGLSPGWHHLTNVVLHTGNVFVLLLLLLRMTGAFWRSTLVAALFAVHPLHVESVAWVAERKDVLCCLFWLLTIWVYVDYSQGSLSRRKYILSLSLFMLAVMSKPTAVTLPFILPLLDYWPLKRLSLTSARALLKEKIPFFLVSLASSMITYLNQAHAGTMVNGQTIPEGMRIANAMVSYTLYLRDLIWPQSLGVLYPYPLSIPGVDVFLSVTILAAITTFVVCFARKLPYLPVGWLWFLGVLVPMIGWVQVGPQARADRFTYISAIGIFLMVAWGAAEAARYYNVPKMALIGLAAAIVFTLAARSGTQVRYWESGESLYTHTITITGRNPILKRNLGSMLNNQHRLPEAERYFRSALLEDPGFVDAYADLGINLVSQRKWSEGLNVLTHALGLTQNNPALIYQRAVALSQLDRVPEAIQGFQDALRYLVRPADKAAAHEYLGQLWLKAGQNQTALTEADTALAISPDLVEARAIRALALAQLGGLQPRVDTAVQPRSR